MISAGSTVVHTIGGMIALAGAIVLDRASAVNSSADGGGLHAISQHDHRLRGRDHSGGSAGHGFNPGSTLSGPCDTAGIARRGQYHAGGLHRRIGSTAVCLSPAAKKWDCGANAVNGLLAVPGGHHLSVLLGKPPFGAMMLGLIAGVVVILATDLLEYLRIDDPCGA